MRGKAVASRSRAPAFSHVKLGEGNIAAVSLHYQALLFNCKLKSHAKAVRMAESAHCKTIKTSLVAKPLEDEVTAGVKALAKAPLLVGLLATRDAPAKAYADWTGKTAKEL
jgi:hypothetical protein